MCFVTNVPERKLSLAQVEFLLNFDSIFSCFVCLFVCVERLARDLVVMKSKRRKLSKWRIMILPWKRK